MPEPLPPFAAATRNLVRFCRHLPAETQDASFAGDFAFRDAGSRFMLLKSTGSAPGPDECWGVYSVDARLMFEKLLGLELEYPTLEPASAVELRRYNSINYYRSHLEEHFCDNGSVPAPPLLGRCLVWYPRADCLAVRYELTNQSVGRVPLRLRWFSTPAPDRPLPCRVRDGALEVEQERALAGDRYRVRARVESSDPRLGWEVTATGAQTPHLERTLEGSQALALGFWVRVAFNDEAWPALPEAEPGAASLRASIQRHEAAYARLPRPRGERRRFEPLMLKAAGTLNTLRYRDRTTAGVPIDTIHAGKTGCAATWFWDSAFGLLGLGVAGDHRTARGAVRLLTRGIRADGTPPCKYQAGRYLYGYQMPILAWGLGLYLGRHPDAALLRQSYGPLCRYAENWWALRREPGLVIYPPDSTALDDSLRWDSAFPLGPQPRELWWRRRWGQMRHDQFASPDVNAFLYLELRTLAAMARALGRAAEAQRWTERARTLGAAIHRHLWDPKRGVYQDLHLASGRFTGLVSTAGFLPIYAGLAPRTAAVRACRSYLLNPRHFLTTFCFPVVDAAHVTYRPGGALHEPSDYPGSLVQQAYWRGRTWIHCNFWLLGALWQAGLRAQADALADRVLDHVGRNEAIAECYDSQTGQPNGHNEFLWSAAAVLALGARDYRRPPVAKLAATAAARGRRGGVATAPAGSRAVEAGARPHAVHA